MAENKKAFSYFGTWQKSHHSITKIKTGPQSGMFECEITDNEGYGPVCVIRGTTKEIVEERVATVLMLVNEYTGKLK